MFLLIQIFCMVCQVKAPLYSDQLLLLSLIPTAVPLIAIVASLSPTWQLQGLARQARALLAIPANSRKTNQFAVCFVLFSPFFLNTTPSICTVGPSFYI